MGEKGEWGEGEGEGGSCLLALMKATKATPGVEEAERWWMRRVGAARRRPTDHAPVPLPLFLVATGKGFLSAPPCGRLATSWRAPVSYPPKTACVKTPIGRGWKMDTQHNGRRRARERRRREERRRGKRRRTRPRQQEQRCAAQIQCHRRGRQAAAIGCAPSRRKARSRFSRSAHQPRFTKDCHCVGAEDGQQKDPPSGSAACFGSPCMSRLESSATMDEIQTNSQCFLFFAE